MRIGRTSPRQILSVGLFDTSVRARRRRLRYARHHVRLRHYGPQQISAKLKSSVHENGLTDSESSSVDDATQKLLEEFGFTETEADEVLEEARKYWQRRSGKTQRTVSINNAEDILTYLADYVIRIRDIPHVIQSCPPILFVSLYDEILPMIELLKTLNIEGKAVTRLCMETPFILFEGNRKSIENIVYALRDLGIHESRVKKLIQSYPPILSLSTQSFNKKMKQLTKLFSSQEDLVVFFCLKPQLIDDSNQRFERIFDVVQQIGMSEKETLQFIRKEPKLLSKPPEKMREVLTWLSESGFEPHETKKVILGYPQLLIRRVSVLNEKKKFLELVGERSFRDVLSFPNYLNYAISRVSGPRFAFLRERGNPAFKTASLESIVRTSNKQFAENVANVLEAEYLVYQAQWTRVHGHKFNYTGRPKKERHEE